MVDLAAEQLLHHRDDPPAAGDRAVDVVLELVADPQGHGTALAVVTDRGVGTQPDIGAGDSPQQFDLLGRQQLPGDEKPVLVPGGLLIAVGHGARIRTEC